MTSICEKKLTGLCVALHHFTEAATEGASYFMNKNRNNSSKKNKIK